jgi:Ca-activated chloride channel family protein
MKSVRYTKFTGDDFGLTAEDLMRALSDYFLGSGFDNPYMQFNEFDENSLDELKRAIEEALMRADIVGDPERAEQIRQALENMSPEELGQMLERMVQKLADEGYINAEQQQGPGSAGGPQTKVDVKITDKSVDFLGFKTLKDLLGSLGRASFGAHDTRDLATGVESTGAAKQYEFGDTLNLDVSQTLFSAMQREGVKLPLTCISRNIKALAQRSSCSTAATA